MDHRLNSYLRTFRRRSGFTQKELAFLIGLESRTNVSRLERSVRRPTTDALIICVFVFGASHFQLFPGLVCELQDAVLERANELYERLQGNPSRTTRAKLDFLEELLAKEGERRINTDI
jgi:transcriptional regulator with XRE-family HTH domain